MTTKNQEVTTMPNVFFNEIATIVKEEDRLDFLPLMFKGVAKGYIGYERLMFNQATAMSEDYKGGLWEFAKTKEGDSFFMFPSGDEAYTIHIPMRQATYKVDGRIFGLLASMIVFSHASFAYFDTDQKLARIYANHYHALRNVFYSAVDRLIHYTDDEGENIPVEKRVKLTKIKFTQIEEMSSLVWSYLD